MIPCPKHPIFIYGSLYTPIKLIVLAGKIEGAMKGKLSGFKLKSTDDLIQTNNPENEVLGELLWINLQNYDLIINQIDKYADQPQQSTQTNIKPLSRFECEVTTNEPVYRGIRPTTIKCWSYKH